VLLDILEILRIINALYALQNANNVYKIRLKILHIVKSGNVILITIAIAINNVLYAKIFVKNA